MNAITMTETPTTLGEFILAEMHKRDLSARQFAALVGVTHTTINKFLEHGSASVGGVSPDFLMKLGTATNTNRLTLLLLAYPDFADDLERLTRLGISSALREERFEQLPENMREAVDTIIFERARSQSNKDQKV